MPVINNRIYHLSKARSGPYSELVERLNTLPEQLDVEQMLSLFEEHYGEKTNPYFQRMLEEVRTDFCTVLTKSLQHGDAYLPHSITSALLRLHKAYGKDMGKEGEQLGVVMTVNFDSILDRAFIEIYGGLDYGIDITPLGINKANSPALLKMHGSFNWRFVNGLNLWKLRGPLGWGTFNGAIVASLDFEKNASRSDSAWLRPSVYKKPGSQLRNLWRIAERTLKEVDTLRVVGCSLRNEDWALISLIFKAQIAHQTGFGIELVVPKQDADERSSIRSRLQFLSKVKPIQDVFKEESDPGNVFKSYVINKYNEVAGKNPEIKGDNAFEGLV